MAFDYSKLRGKIREMCQTQENFAEKIGLSKVSLSVKLNNKVPFTQGEIHAACDVLGIDRSDIAEYFFCPLN
jgi:transcriptional regulator with XRE-family HTH domain